MVGASRAHWVVGLLRTDDKILLCHRTTTRAHYPNTWDLPGGHVRLGEAPHHAVRRELREELGIVVDPNPTPHASFEDRAWSLDCWLFESWDGEIINAEPDEHDKIVWCDEHEISQLPVADERLRPLLMAQLARERTHCVAPIDGDLGQAVDVLRRAWDPLMAGSTPPHLTLAYPEELDARWPLGPTVAGVAQRTAPFQVVLRRVVGIDSGRGGVSVEVDDVEGGWTRTRQYLLGHRTGLRIEPHITIAHPRTCPDPEAAWSALRGTTFGQTLLVQELLVTSARDGTTTVLERHPMRPSTRRR